ncbi:flagellar basal-body rod protein [Enterococcus columbae DSM 7374 = ATCC 51263]|nr:flagellar basal-body rod protein [Enterococcus columbae DSM 7374 = ATCC 51263]
MHNYEDGIKMDQRHEIGGFTFGNELAGAYLNAERGALKNTERLTDFALNGEGYFTIRMNNGQLAYTRNGNFIKNDQNQLLTQEGYQVLGANNQPIVMQDNVKPNFLITNFQDESALISNGDTYYTSNQPGQVIQGSVVQGYLEGSNVSVADEMVKMIQTSREFEANQKALQTVNETLDKAVNELGRV